MRGILINNDNTPLEKLSLPVPWINDADGFNYCRPDVSYNINDNPKFYDEITNKEEVRSIIFFCDVDDYSFLRDFKNLEQLYIYFGKNLKDISFVADMIKLRYLHIGGSQVSDISPIVELTRKQSVLSRENKKSFSFLDQLCCLSIQMSDVSDLSAFEGNEFRLTDLNFGGNKIESIGPIKNLSVFNLVLMKNPVAEKMSKQEIKEIVSAERVYV